jgi:hypothetical protein
MQELHLFVMRSGDKMRNIILISLIGILLLIFSGCSNEVTGDEKTAEEYVKMQGYNISSHKGIVQKYILDKGKLVGSMSTPYQQMWGVQRVSPDNYLGKEITIYGFTISNHPLKKTYNVTTNVYILLTGGKVIGGYSFPNAIMAGGYYSLDGKTLEEVTGLSFKEWSDNWSKKYANEIDENKVRK